MKHRDWSDQRLYTVAAVFVVAGLGFFAAYGFIFEHTTGEPFCDPVLTLEECQR